MSQTTAILTVQSDSETAIKQTLNRLQMAGFQVMRSFDLKVARAAHVGCTCPHHGTDQCDCQMVMLLVYGKGETPVSLVIHGHDGQTQIALVDTPEQRPNQQIVSSVVGAILQIKVHVRKTLSQV